MKQAASIQRALEEFERLPGIGPKSAQRILHWLLTTDEQTANNLADAIVEVKETIHLCPRCFNYAQGDLCEICADPERDGHLICVVAEPRDIDAIERTGSYRGLYHVLGGVINPMEGAMPEDLYISQLMARLGSEDIEEVVLATNPDVEGETTASYLARLIKPLDITVTRLASGLPVGGELEYADEVTLAR
ncbi:MAG: recombination mediator RecR, partial [Coriobacteriaceae bacterium]|nr:recombination mediator RecR [Coriobacteriaceae bacterium]